MDRNGVFFSLLRLGAGLTDYIELPEMNRDVWRNVLNMAQKQAVLGVIIDAIDALPEGVSKPDRDMLVKLLGIGLEIEKRNRLVNREVVRWSDFFRERGFRSVLLKGQGVADFYPNPLHRSPGDIDLWVIGDADGIRSVVKLELSNGEVRYHHIDVDAGNGVELEVHTTPSWMYSYPKNRKLQRLFGKWVVDCREIELPDAGKVLVPSDEMNRVYMLVHIYRHVFHEGIGLRQLLDYALLLKKGCSEHDKVVFTDYIKSLGLTGFAGAVMYVMKVVFGLEDCMLLVSTDVERGRKLLENIMEGGNFGMYDSSIDRSVKKGTATSFFVSTIRNFRLIADYPEEVLWSPFFKVWHYIWRKLK